jgi:hypothetical protein
MAGAKTQVRNGGEAVRSTDFVSLLPCVIGGILRHRLESWLVDLDAEKVATRDKPLAACQLIDKALFLRGRANAWLEVREGQPTIESVNQLKALLDSPPELDAEVIESKAEAEKAGGRRG